MLKGFAYYAAATTCFVTAGFLVNIAAGFIVLGTCLLPIALFTLLNAYLDGVD